MALPYEPRQTPGQTGNYNPAALQTRVGDDACIVPGTPRRRRVPRRDLRPKSLRCAAVGLRNAPAGAVNPAPTNQFLCFGANAAADREIAAARTPPGGYGIRPYGLRRGPRPTAPLRRHTPSFLIPHSSFLIPHSSFLIPHSSFAQSPRRSPCVFSAKLVCSMLLVVVAFFALGGSALLYGDFADRLAAAGEQEQGQHSLTCAEHAI